MQPTISSSTPLIHHSLCLTYLHGSYPTWCCPFIVLSVIVTPFSFAAQHCYRPEPICHCYRSLRTSVSSPLISAQRLHCPLRSSFVVLFIRSLVDTTQFPRYLTPFGVSICLHGFSFLAYPCPFVHLFIPWRHPCSWPRVIPCDHSGGAHHGILFVTRCEYAFDEVYV